jgi:hypothetical protein
MGTNDVDPPEGFLLRHVVFVAELLLRAAFVFLDLVVVAEENAGDF